MPSLICEKDDCTVAETGTCLLHSAVDQCPHYKGTPVEKTSEVITPKEVSEKATAPLPGRQFYSSLELGTADSTSISFARYTHFIPILGSYNVGKTCFLSSLYLLASHPSGLHPDIQFAGSLTLQGFEARCRRLRQWDGKRLPEQLTDHTELADARSPSLLHLAFRERGYLGRRIELLLTDLPGEWTDQLIDRANTSHRFSFLPRADGIIVVIDGTLLEKLESRNGHIHRSKLLFSRLAETLKLDVTIPVVLAVSKCDEIASDAATMARPIEEHAKAQGFSCQVVPLCALSRVPEKIQNGQGVWGSISHIINPLARAISAPVLAPLSNRAFARLAPSAE